MANDKAPIVLIMLPFALFALSLLSLSSAYNTMMSTLIFGSSIVLIFQKNKTAKKVGYFVLVLCVIGFIGSFVVRPPR